jgi:release factor glutamine methyltransferase
LNFDRPISSVEHQDFSALITRRLHGEPAQYILGETEFYGMTFHVAPGTLIPRPETERLIDHAAAFLEQRRHSLGRDAPVQLDLFHADTEKPRHLRLIDIGTGSGNIPISLARLFPELQCRGTDISSEALATARRNAERHEVSGQVTFYEGAYFEPLTALNLSGSCDLIVSNPPYIRSGDIATLMTEVRAFEPRIALDGGEDGLDHYRVIIDQAPPYLKKGGMALLEIGSDQAEDVTELLRNRGFADIEVIRDYNHHNRVVSALFNEERRSTDDQG